MYARFMNRSLNLLIIIDCKRFLYYKTYNDIDTTLVYIYTDTIFR